MDIAQLLVTPIFVLFVSLVGGYLFKDRLEAIEARIDRLEARLDGRIDALDGRIDALPTRVEIEALVVRVSRLEDVVDALRADITQIALAVGARLKPQTG